MKISSLTVIAEVHHEPPTPEEEAIAEDIRLIDLNLSEQERRTKLLFPSNLSLATTAGSYSGKRRSISNLLRTWTPQVLRRQLSRSHVELDETTSLTSTAFSKYEKAKRRVSIPTVLLTPHKLDPLDDSAEEVPFDGKQTLLPTVKPPVETDAEHKDKSEFSFTDRNLNLTWQDNSVFIKSHLLQVVEHLYGSKVVEKLKSSGGDIGVLKRGAIFWKVKGPSKFYRRRFWLDPNQPILRYDPSKKNPCVATDPEIDVTTILDVLPGWKTEVFNEVANASKETGGLNENACFSIVYGENGYDVKTLDLVGEDVKTVQEWIKGLQSLVIITKSIQQEREYEDWLLAQYKRADKDGNNSLDFQECLKLLKLLNMKLEEEHVKKLFDQANTNKHAVKGAQVLDAQEFITFYKLLLRRPEIEALFSKYAKTSLCSMTAGELCSFLQKEQKMHRCNVEQAVKYIELYETTHAKLQERMTVSGFTNLMLAEDFDILSTKEKDVWMDMTQPLNHYYISSSHNTYLLGNQLTGESSVQAYVTAFLNGCRCVELDLWDGKNGEPVITHGNTMTSDIYVRDVLQDAVLPYAFQCSPYPVILSVENHLSLEQQDVFATMLKDILGDKLYDEEVDENLKKLPSPDMLKNKVIVKSKKSATRKISTGSTGLSNGVESESESDSELPSLNGSNGNLPKVKNKKKEKVRVSEKLSSLVNLCQAVHFKGLDETISNGKVTHMSSLAEGKAIDLIQKHPEKFVAYAQRQLVRIYPTGTRVGSSNLDPIPYWNAGSQIVALNLQTSDHSTRVNAAKFRVNGLSGYVLKPEYLLRNSSVQTESVKRLLIKVISGQSLPYVVGEKNDIVDPYVNIQIFGYPEDEVKHKTKYISNNGFNPAWNEDFSFVLKRPELDVVSFEVKDHDKHGKNDLIGSYYIWATAIAPGYRHIPLVDKTGKNILAASIFVHISYE